MENVIIDGMLYKMAKSSIQQFEIAKQKGLKAHSQKHEEGTAYEEYNDLVDIFKKQHTGEIIYTSFDTY